MPVISDINLTLNIKQVLRRQRFGENPRLIPQFESLIRELLDTVESERLLKPSIAYEVYSVVDIDADRVQLEGDVALYGTCFHSVLSGARELAVAIYTIGPALEEMTTRDFQRGEPLRGMLLDSIGSAALEPLGEKVCAYIRDEATSRGYQSSSGFDPGVCDFPISEQRRLLELVPAEEIGVSLTDSGMLIPLKSISTIIGMGPQMPMWSQAEICARCNLGRTCHYSIHAQAGKKK